jgi:hypothetical protein
VIIIIPEFAHNMLEGIISLGKVKGGADDVRDVIK